MGIEGLTSRVITKYLADTSDQRREIDSLIKKNEQLQQSERDAAAAREQHFDQLTLDLSRQNRQTQESAMSWDGYSKKATTAKTAHEQLTGAFTKGIAIAGAAALAYSHVRESLRAYGEHARLEAATLGINIERLSDSFNGLITQHDLLTMAAQTQNGVLRLNQGEMETVGRAAVALKNRGFDLEDAFKKLTEAAVKGKVGGLDDLGLSIKEGASKAETLKNMMTELNRVIGESGSATSDSADDVRRLAVEWENAADAAKRYTVEALKGLSFDDMEKHLLDKVARTGYVKGVDGVGFQMETPLAAMLKAFDRAQGLTHEEQQALYAKGARVGMQRREDAAHIDFEDGYAYDREGRQKASADAAKKAADEKRKRDEQHAKYLQDIRIAWRKSVEDAEKALEEKAREEGTAKPETSSEQYYAQMGFGGLGAGTGGPALPDEIQERRLGYLEAALGPVEQFDAYEEGFAKLGETFDAFGQAVGSSYEAIVTGQGSVSTAFKKVMADGLMAIGKSSAIEALRETALGFASLALGPLGGASAGMHFKAAALHAGVAVAAGVAANQLGTSAQVSASEAASKEKAKEEEKAKKEREKEEKKRSGESDRDAPTYIILGSHFDDMTPRQRRAAISAGYERAQRERDE